VHRAFGYEPELFFTPFLVTSLVNFKFVADWGPVILVKNTSLSIMKITSNRSNRSPSDITRYRSQKFQLRASVAILNGKDTIVTAGTSKVDGELPTLLSTKDASFLEVVISKKPSFAAEKQSIFRP
jgi:hypothetical protein